MAQYDDTPLPKSLRDYEPRKWDEKKIKMTAGGSLGAQFGNGYSAVSISPVYGIYPTVDWLLLGVGGTYMFSYDNYFGASHDFGLNAFVRGLIWKRRIVAHVGYEYFNFDFSYSTSPDIPNRVDAHALYIGPGYRQSAGENVNIFILLLFNVGRWSRYDNIFDTRNVFPFMYPVIGVTFDF